MSSKEDVQYCEECGREMRLTKYGFDKNTGEQKYIYECPSFWCRLIHPGEYC